MSLWPDYFFVANIFFTNAQFMSALHSRTFLLSQVALKLHLGTHIEFEGEKKVIFIVSNF